MAFIVPHSVADNRDLDNADLCEELQLNLKKPINFLHILTKKQRIWVTSIINSASKSRKSLVIGSPNFQSLSLISNPLLPSKLSKYPKTLNSNHSDTKSRVSAQGEVIQEPYAYHPPGRVARTCALEASYTSPLIVLKNVQRMPTTLVYSSPKAHLSSEIGKFSVKELSPRLESYGRSEEKHMVHSLSRRFPSASTRWSRAWKGCSASGALAIGTSSLGWAWVLQWIPWVLNDS